jgi:hypothetical protein
MEEKKRRTRCTWQTIQKKTDWKESENQMTKRFVHSTPVTETVTSQNHVKWIKFIQKDRKQRLQLAMEFFVQRPPSHELCVTPQKNVRQPKEPPKTLWKFYRSSPGSVGISKPMQTHEKSHSTRASLALSRPLYTDAAIKRLRGGSMDELWRCRINLVPHFCL